MAVAASGLGVGLAAGQGGFLKGGVGIGAQHLGPFVAVVTGRITTGKNMAEAVRCAVPGRGLEHGNLRAHFAQHAHEVSPCSRFAVQAHVKQRELDLAQGLQPALKIFGGQHLVEQGAWQGLAGVHMRGHMAQHAPFPAKVFHELAGQLHRVPFDAADTGDVALVDLCQHVVQPVAAFMKEGDHVIVRQQRRLAAHAFGKVAHQMGHRGLQRRAVRAQPAGAHIVHPGTAALACAGAGV